MKARNLTSSPAGESASRKSRATEISIPDPLLLLRYQELTRKHLNKTIEHLLPEHTGMGLHMVWAPKEPTDWTLPTFSEDFPPACSRWRTEIRRPCQGCPLARFTWVMAAGCEGRHFECGFGRLSFFVPVRVRGLVVGIAYLQALASRDHGTPVRPSKGRRQVDIVDPRAFRRAARLLRAIVGYLETLDLAELRRTELASAGEAILALEREQARLREALERVSLTVPKLSHRPGPATHGEEAVRQLLDWIRAGYMRPLTLKACAEKFRLNSAYLSDLFKHATGVSFKTYLTEFRMAKAQVLLGDLGRTVSEVAYAVGYASENRFRAVFKKSTGVAPGSWRKTLQSSS